MAEVRLEVDVAHPPGRVWRALTDADLLGRWLMSTDLQPHEGGTFTLHPGELSGFLGPISGEVSELDPPCRIAMLWQGEKLHTRVVWELVETAGGCQVRVIQTGFIGAPADLRRRALRATYTTLFAERLPAVLDELAADEAAGPTAVPRQREGATAIAAGHGARPAGSADRAERPAALIATTGSLAAAAVEAAEAARIPAQRTGTDPGTPPGPGVAGGASEARWSRRAGQVLARWGRRLRVLPAWGRAVAIGGAAAVLAVAVLAAMIQPAPEPPDDPIAGQGDRAGPDTGVQPGMSGEAPPDVVDVPGDSGTGASSREPASSQPSAPAATPSPGGAEPTPSGTGSPGPGMPESEPVLTADVTTSGRLLGLSGSTVSVMVSNPGTADAESWEVTLDVGDQDVTNVSGAAYVRDGSVATFTPREDGAAGDLAAGESVAFSFDLPGEGLLGLGGAAEPTDCTIDGNPC